jgi:hypothetical protein
MAGLPEEVTSRARTQGNQPETKLETRAEPDAALCKCLPPPGGGTGKNLVVCVDGTANQFSEKVSSIIPFFPPSSVFLNFLAQNSNVVELYSRLVKSNKQMTYYNSGIGTFVKDSKSWLSYGAWKQSFNHGLDMAIATYAYLPSWISIYLWSLGTSRIESLVPTNGSQNIMNRVIKSFCLVSTFSISSCPSSCFPLSLIIASGFSRGAYQVRVIAGMIEKVCWIAMIVG